MLRVLDKQTSIYYTLRGFALTKFAVADARNSLIAVLQSLQATCKIPGFLYSAFTSKE